MKEFYSSLRRGKINNNSYVYYTTPRLLSQEQLDKIVDFHYYVWQNGDRYIDLSYKYYNSTEYWWIIAMFNKTPLDNMIMPGETIYIPMDLYAVLELLRESNNGRK